MLSALQKWLPGRGGVSADAAYIAAVAQARHPFFYETLGVPDSLDGRFELIVLHMFLLQQRLLGEAPDLARRLSEVFFRDMDRSLREMGISDTGVPRRIKAMGKAYHGRLQAYATADREALLAALARNLFGTVEQGETTQLARVAEYMERAKKSLADASIETIERGDYAWPGL